MLTPRQRSNISSHVARLKHQGHLAGRTLCRAPASLLGKALPRAVEKLGRTRVENMVRAYTNAPVDYRVRCEDAYFLHPPEVRCLLFDLLDAINRAEEIQGGNK